MDRSITEIFSSVFSYNSRVRGAAYHNSGKVDIRTGDAYSVDARVRGSQWYSVEIAIEEEGLFIACSCPYYDQEREACKHIWATLLEAEELGYLEGDEEPIPRRVIFDDNEEVEVDDDEDDWEPMPFPPRRRRGRPGRPTPSQPTPKTPPAPATPTWERHLGQVTELVRSATKRPAETWPADRELYYVIDIPTSRSSAELVVDVMGRDRLASGEWGKLKAVKVTRRQINLLPDAADRRAIAALVGARDEANTYYNNYRYNNYYYNQHTESIGQTTYRLPESLQPVLLPDICATGRCLMRTDYNQGDLDALSPLAWDNGAPWDFHLVVSSNDDGYKVHGEFRRDDERMSLREPLIIFHSGVAIGHQTVFLFNDDGAFPWISHLRTQGDLDVPSDQADQFLERLMTMTLLPKLDVPKEMQYEEVAVTPRPVLRVSNKRMQNWGPEKLVGDLSFEYEGVEVSADHSGRGVYHHETKRLLLRDHAAEVRAREHLVELGFKERKGNYGDPPYRELAPKKLPGVVRQLMSEEWRVEADGKLYRTAMSSSVQVKSGIDWFELHGEVDFGGITAHLPALLAALRKGENTVLLDDGTFGLLPEQWLAKIGAVAGMGKATDDHLRFSRAQVGLLDALLMAQPEADVDATFQHAREELMSFRGIEPMDPPKEFTGTLRPYQREGLGWLHFLRRFGFGGCLADAMGLGKTVMILALLESRRKEREEREREIAMAEGEEKKTTKKKGRKKKEEKQPIPERIGPSLAVVPKSLIFNWMNEAERFTPDLRVLDHTGNQRLKTTEHFEDYDLILTTYGTLLKDVADMKDVRFDYAILDEAQAIKNPSTASAKASRLINADHRLALSGTPVENHLGELWSIFEFLNPGLLGSTPLLKGTANAARMLDEESLTILRQALRPFILRRTKEQVAKDLPARVEQTIYCELDAKQRKQYDELRAHYRDSLLGLIDEQGMNRSKMHVLEALLRLRQAACHPGLIDKKKVKESSAKLDVLMEQIAEVIDGGSKALIFSQFTTLLGIVRNRLDKEGITYEYLDGKTRDRQQRVDRFQTDDDCKLFLISLKAGGVGLNLTAADHVFLLDPWWNPAVEAQAIDRTHRIGQQRQVFASRIIARDTVEEKVLELQKSKRDLADAIITADNSLIRSLGREDLELLLS